MNNNTRTLQLKLYLAVLAGLALISAVGYHFVLQYNLQLVALLYVGLLYMPTPLYALIIASKLSKTPLRLSQYGTLSALRPRQAIEVITVFMSWVVVFFGLSSILSVYMPAMSGGFTSNTTEVRANIAKVAGDAAAASANLPDNIWVMVIMMFLSAIVAGLTINLLFALGEEYGWRGYIAHSIQGSGIYRHSIVGLLWGVWHLPLIVQGYNYGTAYWLSGSLVFMLFAVSFGYVFGVLYEKYHSVILAGALHGMFNGLAGIFVIVVNNYNPVLNGPVGVVSAVSMLIVAAIYYGLNRHAIVRAASVS